MQRIQIGAVVCAMASLWCAASALAFSRPFGATPPSATGRTGTPPPRSAGGAQTPAIFDRRPYDEAKSAAERDDKWFIVKATAVWCGPCKRMDATTWVDPKVVAWAEANAIVVSLDVDKSRETAKSLEISAMPTMVAFKGGKQFDRIVGFRSAEQLLAWFEGLARGETSVEATRKRLPDRGAKDADAVQARYRHAQQLMQARKLEEATEEFAWVWTNSREAPGFGGVRVSFMASDMKQLAKSHDGARKRFAEMRDQLSRAIEAPKVDRDDFGDWIVLNEILEEQDATLKWIDRALAEPRLRPLIRNERRIADLLIEQGRWADIGALSPDPVADMRDAFSALAVHRDFGGGAAARDRAMNQRARQALERLWREQAGRIYAGVLAQARGDEATAAASEAISLDPEPALVVALVSSALKAAQPRREQITWLDAAIAKLPTDDGAAEQGAPTKASKPADATDDDGAIAALEAVNAARDRPGRQRLESLRGRVEAALKQAPSSP